MTTKLISGTCLQHLRRYDHKPESERARLLDEVSCFAIFNHRVCIKAWITLFRSILLCNLSDCSGLALVLCARYCDSVLLISLFFFFEFSHPYVFGCKLTAFSLYVKLRLSDLYIRTTIFSPMFKYNQYVN
jgi:hypothetical protein